jgi:internalin A
MKSIESFRFGDIDIKDGNVAHLLSLNDFGFYPNKRHYSHTREELEEIQQDNNKTLYLNKNHAERTIKVYE